MNTFIPFPVTWYLLVGQSTLSLARERHCRLSVLGFFSSFLLELSGPAAGAGDQPLFIVLHGYRKTESVALRKHLKKMHVHCWKE